jgi:hypothetical protein
MARFDNLGKAIGMAISKDESGIKELLRRNGVSTNNIKTKLQLSDVFIESLVVSKGLGKDFSKYIKSKDNANASGYLAMDNFANVVGDGVPEAYNMSGATISNTDIWSGSGASLNVNVNADGDEEEEEDSSNGGFFSGLNLADIINQASKVYLAQLESKDVKNETEQIKVASETQINSDLNIDSPNVNTSNNKSNTGLYIGLGALGLVLVVGAVYVFTKNKK